MNNRLYTLSAALRIEDLQADIAVIQSPFNSAYCWLTNMRNMLLMDKNWPTIRPPEQFST